MEFYWNVDIHTSEPLELPSLMLSGMRGLAGVITQVGELLLYKQHEVPLIPLVNTKLIPHSILLKYGPVGHCKLLIFCSLIYNVMLDTFSQEWIFHKIINHWPNTTHSTQDNARLT